MLFNKASINRASKILGNVGKYAIEHPAVSTATFKLLRDQDIPSAINLVTEAAKTATMFPVQQQTNNNLDWNTLYSQVYGS